MNSTFRLIAVVAIPISFSVWFISIALHVHLNPTVQASFGPVFGSLGFRGDKGIAEVGIASMSVLMASVFVLRTKQGKAHALFDAFMVGSLLAFVYEMWVLFYQTNWYSERFTALTGLDNYSGYGLTNQLVAEVSFGFIIAYCSFILATSPPLRRKALVKVLFLSVSGVLAFPAFIAPSAIAPTVPQCVVQGNEALNAQIPASSISSAKALLCFPIVKAYEVAFQNYRISLALLQTASVALVVATLLIVAMGWGNIATVGKTRIYRK